MTRPCSNCPFRADRPFALGRKRVAQIEKDTETYPFSCHKTVDYGDAKPAEYEEGHCAGALILREKLGRPSLVMRFARMVGVYDPSRLEMDAPVYDSWEAMKEGCKIPGE
jgi:hypothetical protein